LRDGALGEHAEMLGVEVHVLDVKVDEFLQPDAGPEEDLDDDAVPDGQRGCPAAKFLEQTALLGLGQKLGGSPGKPAKGQRPGRILPDDPVLLGPGEERPDSRLEPVHGRRRADAASSRGRHLR